MKTVLVTGGAGFIGSNFVHHLYEKYPDYRIIVLDALTYAGSVHNLPHGSWNSNRFEFVYGNVRNGELVDALMAQTDVVVHFAAESHVTRSIFDNSLFFETDVLGTQTIANAVLKHRDRVERFIHISTSEVYGTAVTERMDEDHPLNPMSPYAAAKAGADRLVYSYWRTYDIPAIIVRPFNNYGPRQHLEKLIPRFITSCLLGEALRVHGDGSAARDFVFAKDHCEAIDLIMHADKKKLVGEVLNVGTGTHLNIIEIAEVVREVMNCPQIKLEKIQDRPGQVHRHTADIRKIKELVGWEPRTDFREGIRQTAEWYRAHEVWWQPQRWLREIPIMRPDGQKVIH